MARHARRVLLGVSVFVGVVVVTHAAPAAPSYTYTRIADTLGPFRELLTPSLNNRGDVVFGALLHDGGRTMLTGNEDGLVVVADTRTDAFDQMTLGSINDRGIIAFVSYREGDGAADTVWTWDHGQRRRIADTRDGRFLYTRGSPQINASGAVAFWARTADGFDGIFVQDKHGPLRMLVGGPAFATLDAVPAFTDSGKLAFGAQLAGTGLNTIMVADQRGVRLLADNTGRFHVFSPAPGLNAAGTVVFHAGQDGGPYVIATVTHAGERDVADNGDNGVRFREVYRPTINAVGTVAFQAITGGRGVAGVFTGPDPVADRVIGGDDTWLDGDRIESVDFFRGLNDRGQIAFVAHFLTWSALYRADPR
jgi:hypothetical protein